ncbi:MAG: 2-oxoglutarate dehydrogenase, E2 component, dihydrolipoamide succinyltransferase [Actinomycetaceae bacterium]|nr:2-oxoglutarate dehydrogenase, E2 component, dihydrolipoamide succinyltransferase [Actinomycetaceae bacterium]
MSHTVQMPALGESVTEGTVTRWLKNLGDSVEVDEPLLEVSTDKVDTEVPSPAAGVLTEILVEEDQTVDVGTPVCTIGDAGAAASPAEQPVEQPAEQAQQPERTAADVPNPEIPSSVVDTDSGPVVSWRYPQVPPIPEKAPASVAPAAPAAPAAPTAPQSSDTGTAVSMPALGESVTEGTVTRWLKAEGETLEVDEPLLEVSTDKVDTEVPSPVAGTLSKIVVPEDETVAVGTVLAYVGGAPVAPSAPAAPAPVAQAVAPAPAPPTPPAAPAAPPALAALATPVAPAAPAAPSPAPAAPVAPATPAATPAATEGVSKAAPASYVTPIVRKLAIKEGVDLTTVKGTGVGGRIRKEDVLAVAEAARQKVATADAQAPKAPATPAVASPLRGTTEKMSRLRQVIATRMIESLQVSAQLTTVVEVDMTRIVSLRARAKDSFLQREGTKLTYLPFMVKAACEALKAHPKINASINGNEVIYHESEHIGIAVDTDRGLMVPVIRNVGDLTIGGIAKKINDLASRTREGKVSPDELSGSTFTITNTGSGGALFDTPIINQPEVAILGTGAIVKRPAVVVDADGNDSFAIRSMCYLALSYDHRLVDGADAARYLTDVKRRLEAGDFSADLGL